MAVNLDRLAPHLGLLGTSSLKEGVVLQDPDNGLWLCDYVSEAPLQYITASNKQPAGYVRVQHAPLLDDVTGSLAMLARQNWTIPKLVERIGNQLIGSQTIVVTTSQPSYCCCKWSGVEWQFSLESVPAEWYTVPSQCVKSVSGGLVIVKEWTWETEVTVDSVLRVLRKPL